MVLILNFPCESSHGSVLSRAMREIRKLFSGPGCLMRNTCWAWWATYSPFVAFGVCLTTLLKVCHTWQLYLSTPKWAFNPKHMEYFWFFLLLLKKTFLLVWKSFNCGLRSLSLNWGHCHGSEFRQTDVHTQGTCWYRTFPDFQSLSQFVYNYFFRLQKRHVIFVLYNCIVPVVLRIDLPRDDSSVMFNSRVYFCSIIITNLPFNCVCPAASTHWSFISGYYIED